MIPTAKLPQSLYNGTTSNEYTQEEELEMIKEMQKANRHPLSVGKERGRSSSCPYVKISGY